MSQIKVLIARSPEGLKSILPDGWRIIKTTVKEFDGLSSEYSAEITVDPGYINLNEKGVVALATDG